MLCCATDVRFNSLGTLSSIVLPCYRHTGQTTSQVRHWATPNVLMTYVSIDPLVSIVENPIFFTIDNKNSLGIFFKNAVAPIARFMGPTLGPSGTDRTLVGPMLAPWTLLSGGFRWEEISAMWRFISCLTLHWKVIACCLFGSIRYLNQCWLIITWNLNRLQWRLHLNSNVPLNKMHFVTSDKMVKAYFWRNNLVITKLYVS